jgi:membrane protease YdiL (CAAX protease family)
VVVLASVILLLAVLNALSEEVVWRDRSVRILLHGCRPDRAVIAAQALSFGLAHAYGLPGGVLGFCGALVLGLALGLLRFRGAGLFGCVLVHAAVDVAIFIVVVLHVVWIGPAERP